MLRRLLVLLLCVIPLGFPASAQTVNLAITPSGRLLLELPDGWVYRALPEEEELFGLDSESMVLGTSFEAIESYLALEAFDGTVVFLSAYPYSIFEPENLNDPVAMLQDVTTFAEEDLTEQTIAGYPGVEFYLAEEEFFGWQVLFNTPDVSYVAFSLSTRVDDYDTVVSLINTAQVRAVSEEVSLDLGQARRTVSTEGGNLQFDIPESWYYWNESDSVLSFASDGTGYDGLSYAFAPNAHEGISFLVYRVVPSGLREGEVSDGQANLEQIADRLISENGGLRKDDGHTPTDWQGLRRLDGQWLVAGESGVTQTHTVLLDAGEAVYIVQAQYDAEASNVYIPMVDSILESMAYTASESPVSSGDTGLLAGQTAPDYTLPNLQGGSDTLTDYRGTVVLMNLWASWCAPCHREAPHLQSAYEAYNGAFEILAVDVGESIVEAGNFAAQYDLTFPILLDDFERVAAQYELTAYPTTYVIGRDGVILEVIRGSFSEQALQDLLAFYVGRPE